MNKANLQKYRLSKRLYSIKEASEYLGRSVCAVREMIWAGKIPFIKDGRRILLDISDLDTWIEQKKCDLIDFIFLLMSI